MTWIDLVRKYFPDATDDEANYLLWNETSFPFSTVEEIEGQLKNLADALRYQIEK